MTVKAINHVSLVCRDYDAMARFLQAVLQCEPHSREGWFRIPGCPTVIHVISIEDAELPSESEMFHYYTHNAFEVDDLHAVVGRALDGGYTVFQMDNEGEEKQIKRRKDPLSFGIKTVFVRDSDNNLWEFVAQGHSWDELFR